jgi:hypothetical protein
MMKLIWLVFALTVAAAQAQALSCLRPDPVRTFAEIAASADDYYILYGQLTFDELGVADAERSTQIPAQFTGKGLTQSGFTSDYTSPATVQINCIANYCGSAQSGIDALYFVRADQTPVTMVASPCGGRIFPEPTQAVLDQMTACMQGGC